MATIRERGGKFQVQVRMRGFPSRTASFPLRRQAKRWATIIEAEMIEDRHFRSAEARRRTISAAIDRYIEEELPKKRSGRMCRNNLPWWRQRIGNLRLADVTPAVLADCRRRLQTETYTRAKPESKRSVVNGQDPARFRRSPSTVNRYLSVLSHVFTVARKEWHWIADNPFDGVAKLKEGPGRVRFLSADERARLLAETAKTPKLHTFVVLALSTAARAGELQQLTWHDVDLNAGRILLNITKNGDPRTAWVRGDALRLLKEHENARHLDASPVFTSATGKLYRYQKEFAAACEAAQVKDFTFHDLRHSAATYLAREGATEQQLRAIGGWKSNVVSRYVHLAAEDTRSVVERMNGNILGWVNAV